MNCETRFDDLVNMIRTGLDVAARPRVRAEVAKQIEELEDVCDINATSVLSVLADYYYAQGDDPWGKAMNEIRRVANQPSTPTWLALRCLILLPPLTLLDPSSPSKTTREYRKRALELARKLGDQRRVCAVLANWMFAELELGNAADSADLLAQVDLEMDALPANEKDSRLTARLEVSRARLLIADPSRSSRRRADGLFRKALHDDHADHNRRVGLYGEWAEAYLREGPHKSPERALRRLNKASRVLDAAVTDLHRGYFHDLRAQTLHELSKATPARAAQRRLSYLREAAQDARRAVDLYAVHNHPNKHKVRSLLEELTMQEAKSELIPSDVRESLALFQDDHPESTRTAFVMMEFANTRFHQRVFEAIKDVLGAAGITALRADQKEYNPSLLSNVRTYMHGCDFGIAVFERIEHERFNPNVGLEVGYMMALGKKVCLLKEKTISSLQADLLGQLYRPFDMQNIKPSVSSAMSSWVEEHFPG